MTDIESRLNKIEKEIVAIKTEFKYVKYMLSVALVINAFISYKLGIRL